MAMKRLIPAMLVLAASSCITVRLSGASGSSCIYQVSTPAPGRVRGVDASIRLRDFTSSIEYDRTDMVLVDVSGRVTRSGGHRWASSPSTALGDILARDLVSEGFFSVVYRRSMLGEEDMVLEGYVREYGARETPAGWIALIDTEILLFLSSGGRPVLQAQLRFEAPLDSLGYPALAEAMNGLVLQWSDSTRSVIRSAASATLPL